MNRLLDRNRESLTPREKEELWQRVRNGAPPRRRRAPEWRLPALAGAGLAAVVVALLIRPDRTPPSPAESEATATAPALVSESAPVPANPEPGAGMYRDAPTPEQAPAATAAPAPPATGPGSDGEGLPPSLAASARPRGATDEGGPAAARSAPIDRESEAATTGDDRVSDRPPLPAGRSFPDAGSPADDPSDDSMASSGSVAAVSVAERASSASPAGALPPSVNPMERSGDAVVFGARPAGGSGHEQAMRPVGAGRGTIRGHVTDSKGAPLAYADVSIESTPWSAFTRDDGGYEIANLPAGSYSIRCSLVGFQEKRSGGIRLEEGRTVTVDFRLETAASGLREKIRVIARRDQAGTQSTRSAISPDTRELKNLPYATGKDELHIRGGRSPEVGPVDVGSIVIDVPTVGLSVAPIRRNGVPVVPYTGGSALPNDAPYDAMFFEHYGVNPFIPADEDALSTFAVDVDNASYTVMRRYVELGNLPPRDAVRLEEFVNYFPQGYPQFEEPDFRIFVDGAPSPFGRGYQLLRVGIKGRVVEEHDRKPATLVFVIDTSGSMDREGRLELVKRGLGILVGRLRAGDEVGIVVYGSRGRVILDPVRIDREEHAEDRAGDGEPDEGSRERRRRGEDEFRSVDGRFDDSLFERYGDRGPRARILRAIESLHPDGSTNAEEGLRLGYEMARNFYRPGAVNRIILCSDGVANVGRTGPESILEEVRRSADKGITLTTVGFGMGNYNDVLMEQLADRGDGNYYYVDDLEEARRVFLENLTGTLQTIAMDAKVQVEFDAKRVLRYRLLGFENRDVADRDFRNDRVDAGEIGAGHEVTALYEVKLAEGVKRGSIATVRFRYARPEREQPRRLGDEEGEGSGEGEESRGSDAHEPGRSRTAIEIERSFDASDLHRRFDDAPPEFRLDAAVAEFAEILRKSYWAKDSRIEDLLPVARDAANDLGTEEAREFVRILWKAEGLTETVEPDESR